LQKWPPWGILLFDEALISIHVYSLEWQFVEASGFLLFTGTFG